jgi:flagellar hook assembly protein FlgD
VSVTISNSADTEVFSFSVDPGVSTYTVDIDWSALISSDTPLPPGTYTVRLFAMDATAQSVEDEATVDIVAPGAPSIGNLSADPIAFVPAAGDTTRLTADIASVSIRPLTRVALVFTNSDNTTVRTMEWTEDLESAFSLDFTWDGLDDLRAYVAAGVYTATVEATDGFDTQATTSVDITVDPAPAPSITDLTANPDLFTPGSGDSSQITASIATQSVMPLARVELTFLAQDDVPVRTMEWAEDLGDAYELDFSWDGRNQFGSLVAGGAYRARVTAEDGFGSEGTEEVTVTVAAPGAPTMDDLAANPTEFDPRRGEATTVTGTVQSGSVAVLNWVRVRVFDGNQANVTEWIDVSGDSTTYNLEYEWNGTYPSGTTVPGGEYAIEVTGRDALGAEVSDIVSVTVTTPAPPTLTDFLATPDTFDPNVAETTVLSGTASSNTALTSSDVVIRDADGNTVFFHTEEPGDADFTLNLTWDGTYPNNTVVLPGDYVATWTVNTEVTEPASAETTITVTGESNPDQGEDTGGDAQGDAGADMGVDVYIPDPEVEEDENCTCRTVAGSNSGLLRWFSRR